MSAHASLQPAPRVIAAPPRPVPRAKPTKPSRRFSTASIFGTCALALLLFGWRFPTERYITPERGIGYALGIVGGSMMLLLLLYSARKRVSWLRFLGPIVRWFRLHMVLGVLGPICILYHSNFSLGATNSNVALLSMLTVAGSGLIGRYIYSRIHSGLYGRKMGLQELRQDVAGLRSIGGGVRFIPQLLSLLDEWEKRLLSSGPHAPFFGFAKPLFVALIMLAARWELRRCVSRGLAQAASESPVIAQKHRHLKRAANAYVERRLLATRRVAEFEAFERLFSVWHALHLPLLFILVAAATIHIIAVHVY